MGRPRGALVRGDDEPAAGAARAARRRGSVLLAAPRPRGARVGRHREGAPRDARRPPRRGRPHALPRRAPLAVRVESVRVPADLHLLRHRHDALRPQPHGVRDPRPGSALPAEGAREPRGLHGHGRAADEPGQRAGRLRAPPRHRDRALQHRRVDGRVDPRDRADGRGGAAGSPGALAPRGRRGASLRAHARERPLSPARRARRLPALARAPPSARVRRVPDAGRRERPLRAGRGARRSARAAACLQGQSHPLQPDRLGLQRLRPRRDRRLPGRPRGARRPDHRAAHPRPRHRGGVRAARRPPPARSRRGSARARSRWRA
jgi:hypothetical protein